MFRETDVTTEVKLHLRNLAFPVIPLTFVLNIEPPLLDHANPECENFIKKYQPTLMSLLQSSVEASSLKGAHRLNLKENFFV
jgi:hypothetical protein